MSPYRSHQLEQTDVNRQNIQEIYIYIYMKNKDFICCKVNKQEFKQNLNDYVKIYY